MRQGGIEPPAQLLSIDMAKLYFTTKPLALNYGYIRPTRIYNDLRIHLAHIQAYIGATCFSVIKKICLFEAFNENSTYVI